jgi:hypothetical protein
MAPSASLDAAPAGALCIGRYRAGTVNVAPR